MADPNLEFLQKETFMELIKNSVGTTMFRSLMVRHTDTGQIRDVLENGKFSCASFVSSVLYLFEMVEKKVATVKSLREMVSQDPKWKQVDATDIKPGDVIFWKVLTDEDGLTNAHVGFALSAEDAVSTNSKEGIVAKHPIHYREVDVVYKYF